MTIDGSNGNIGIGTTTPSEKLEIYDTQNTPGVISLKSLRSDAGHVDVGRISVKQASTEVARIGMPRAGHRNSGYLTFWTKKDDAANLVESMRINENGNIGIGTATPDSKLSVNGNIHAKEVKIDLVGWPDYVFEMAYKLPSLQHVEQHIKDKGHLQDIPSAKEVAKNGVLLGEMNAKLLQKIEELTLYTIAQEKKINSLEAQKSRIEKLEKENSILKSLAVRLTKLENKIQN
jgi:hypothetical protein